MKFTEFTITTTREASELVSDILWNYTNYGVAISDVNDILDLIRMEAYWDYIDESLTERKNEDVLVKAYVALDETEQASIGIRRDLEKLKENAAGIMPVGTLETVKRVVEGDDWIEIWRKHYRPLQFGKVWICPEWIAHEPGEGEVQVKLDNNMAFGTGEHETTSMCVELMQKYPVAGKNAIDVGCGSGILGITALKLGAAHVLFTDIDYVAVKSAEHNCRLNGVEQSRYEIMQANLLGDSAEEGDVVFANITADVLKILSESITTHLKKGGTLIMSGIIKSKEREVIQSYSALGMTLEERKEKGEWIALVMKRGDK